MSTDTTETVVAYKADGRTYEVDHLGIGYPAQWGEFAVYAGGRHVAGFAIAESLLRPECRPSTLPVDHDDLVRLAKEAVAAESEEG